MKVSDLPKGARIKDVFASSYRSDASVLGTRKADDIFQGTLAVLLLVCAAVLIAGLFSGR